MAVTPDTNIKLLKCNLNLDEFNQINFANATTQYNYFNSLPKLEIDHVTYQRHNNVIRYPAHIDSILEYNYVMYQNHNYSNKWFYAYISRMEYVNDNMTYIYIKTDPYQTWQFNLTFMRSFVEREHVNDDGIGKHLVDEGLELGEFVINDTPLEVASLGSTFVCLVASTDQNGYNARCCKRGKLVDGLRYVGFNVNSTSPTTAQAALQDLQNMIEAYASEGTLNNIVALISLPTILWDEYNAATSETKNLSDMGVSQEIHTTSRNTTINGYTPKNNKLYTNPFNYILVDNNSGACAKYYYEFFSTTYGITFNTMVTGGIGGCNSIYPFEYKGSNGRNYNEGLAGGKFATCAIAGDAYTNWLSQNGLNRAISYVTAAGQIAIGSVAMATPGAGTVAGASMVASGVSGVLNNIQQKHQASYMPPQITANEGSGDLNNCIGKNTFTMYKMSITSERAKIIDGYFSMYGYKVDTVKVPNLTGRRNWNYIKTVDSNIEGYIPQEDLDEIKKMFDNGVTIWHNPSTFLDYSQNNDII